MNFSGRQKIGSVVPRSERGYNIMLKKIGSTARYEIERMLDCKVNLKLWVKVKKDWRDSEFLMKNFGYREEE